MKNVMNFSDGRKIFFTSDTHFFHKKIITYANRPFLSVEEMNQALVDNWNSVVPRDGIVFHLGDFSFGGKTQWNTIRKKLNGKIYLILGNHDFSRYDHSWEQMFKRVTQQMRICIENQEIYLNHNPFLAFGGSYSGTWDLFGHVHSGPNEKNGKDLPRLEYLFPTQYDVGVDNNDFRPVSFYEIREIINKRNIK